MRKKVCTHIITFFFTLFCSSALYAWSDHNLLSAAALSSLKEMKKGRPVKVERLEQFLRKEWEGIGEILGQVEKWAVKNVPYYRPIPENCKLPGKDSVKATRSAFLTVLRVNPEIKIHYYRQVLPGSLYNKRKVIPYGEMTVFKNSSFLDNVVFEKVLPGEKMPPLRVIAAASDEPDYGMDCALWEDNNTPYGKKYGWGVQPFGNASYEYATQAPFHMGFFHESFIIGIVAESFLKTYPEYRIKLFSELAEFAFKAGHDYWGYRFTGWALHYVEDMTQPYHAVMLPGVSTLSLVWTAVKDMLGFPDDKMRSVNLVSNRHTALEELHKSMMVQEYLQGKRGALIKALMNTGKDGTYDSYNDRYIREVITLEAAERADSLDETLEENLPEKYVNDPDYVFSHGNDAIYNEIKGTDSLRKMETILETLMGAVGVHSRSFVKSVIPGGK